MTSDDAPVERLARELYWAEETTPRGRMTTAEIRDGLHDFAALMRAEQRVAIPRGEAATASTSRWRHRIKLALFLLMRPVSWRYDRLLADEAELTTALAERVQQLEAEVAELNARLDHLP